MYGVKCYQRKWNGMDCYKNNCYEKEIKWNGIKLNEMLQNGMLYNKLKCYETLSYGMEWPEWNVMK